jgi:hypothetical protein
VKVSFATLTPAGDEALGQHWKDFRKDAGIKQRAASGHVERAVIAIQLELVALAEKLRIHSSSIGPSAGPIHSD